MDLLGHAAAAANSLQSCPTLCDPIDGNPPDSPVPGILQARDIISTSLESSKVCFDKLNPLNHINIIASQNLALEHQVSFSCLSLSFK